MVLALNWTIKNWKRIGQGDGGFQDDALAGCTQEALDNCANFIKDGKESYLLYFWELIDGHGLLALAIQKLNDDVSAANVAAGVPTVVFRSHGDDQSTDDGSTNKSDSGELKSWAASIETWEQYGCSSSDQSQFKDECSWGADHTHSAWSEARASLPNCC